MELAREQKKALAMAMMPVLAIWLGNGFYLRPLAQFNVGLFWLVDGCQWLLVPFLLLCWLARCHGIRSEHYGGSIPAGGWVDLAGKTLLVFITAYIAFSVDKLFWYFFRPSSDLLSWPELFPQGAMRVLVRLYSSATAGIVESTFFIGLPWLLYQGVFRPANKDRFALLVSTLFALTHWEQGAHVVIGAFCFNFVMCAWYFELKTLWPIALAHAGVDMVEFL